MPDFDFDYNALLQLHLMYNLIASVILVVGLAVLRRVVARFVRRQQDMPAETRRRWLVQTRNLLFALAVVGIVGIWAAELRSVALSVVALAVAIVIASKELILCLSGSLLRGTARSFEIGDRIEVGDIRGDVIDHTLLTTTVVEIGPGKMSHQITGRAVVIPNALFLNVPVYNETFTDAYVLHVLLIPMGLSDDWRRAEALLLQAANEVCSDFIDEARRQLRSLELRQVIEMPPIEPMVSIELPEPDKISLRLRVPAPARRRQRIEQAILRRYLELARESAATLEDA